VVAVLVILDGASEPLGTEPTSLEAAFTPTLDALAAEGTLRQLRTLGPGLPVGSEAAIPALLGWVPSGPVDRAALEAAAQGLELGPGERSWRIDVADGDLTRAAEALRTGAPRHAVRRLSGDRGLLLTGPPPLPTAARSAGRRCPRRPARRGCGRGRRAPCRRACWVPRRCSSARRARRSARRA
jgi:hypothetical protein